MTENFLRLVKNDGRPLPTAAAAQPAPAIDKQAQELSRCSEAEARALLSYERARQLVALPLGLIKMPLESWLTAALGEGQPLDQRSALRFAAGMEIKTVVLPQEVVLTAIDLAYLGDDARLEQYRQDLSAYADQQPSAAPPPLMVDSNDLKGPARFLHELINYAVVRGASDIHLAPTIGGSLVHLRIKSELYHYSDIICPPALHQQLIARIKIMANLDTTIQRLPQDGSFAFRLNSRTLRLRASLMPTLHGEKAVLRIHGSANLFKLSDLSLSPGVMDLLQAFCCGRGGVLLLAGPTGSGKTTTLYAVIQELLKRQHNIAAIEDPVEFELPGVAQTSLNESVGLDYPTCLRSILRQDPDAILLGELRDPDSARTAFEAALTGHKLLATAHARNLRELFLRLRNLGVDLLTVSQALQVVLSQRLVRLLCPRCKVIDLKRSNLVEEDIYKPHGCSYCDYSGFTERQAVAEALWVTPDLAAAGFAGESEWRDKTAKLPFSRYVRMAESLRPLQRAGRISFDDFLTISSQHE